MDTLSLSLQVLPQFGILLLHRLGVLKPRQQRLSTNSNCLIIDPIHKASRRSSRRRRRRSQIGPDCAVFGLKRVFELTCNYRSLLCPRDRETHRERVRRREGEMKRNESLGRHPNRKQTCLVTAGNARIYRVPVSFPLPPVHCAAGRVRGVSVLVPRPPALGWR